MNAKIMIGLGLVVLVWGGTALAYGDGVTGAIILAAGAALTLFGLAQLRRR